MKNIALSKSLQRDKAGTYAFNQLKDKDLELARLKKQGSILPELELEYLIRHGLKPDMNVLDSACGPGLTTSLIYSYLESGSVTGIDINEDLLKEADAHARRERKSIEFLQADVYNLPYESEFDYIYCRFLFQHLEHPQKAIQSLYKALKPGGILHILDVNDEWLYLDPPVPAFDKLVAMAANHQANHGGNRVVGKYLRNLMVAEDFIGMKNEIIPFNSDLIGIETFIQITTNFKVEQIRSVDESENPKALLDQIQKTIREKEIFGMIGVFSISGQKPN